MILRPRYRGSRETKGEKTMKSLERYEQIAMNYVNGNISDFKRDLKRLSKKELLVFLSHLEWALPEEDANGPTFGKSKAHRANNICHKFLD